MTFRKRTRCQSGLFSFCAVLTSSCCSARVRASASNVTIRKSTSNAFAPGLCQMGFRAASCNQDAMASSTGLRCSSLPTSPSRCSLPSRSYPPARRCTSCQRASRAIQFLQGGDTGMFVELQRGAYIGQRVGERPMGEETLPYRLEQDLQLDGILLRVAAQAHAVESPACRRRGRRHHRGVWRSGPCAFRVWRRDLQARPCRHENRPASAATVRE